jgi:CheY-like chemotaxis protein
VIQTNDEPRAILVVDDSSFMRKRVQQGLAPEGYTLVEAANGQLALNELEKRKFDCILTDLVMPELDGFELLAEIQRRKISTPVVVVSADIQKTTQERCAELGAVQFIQKPASPEILRAVVAGILNGRS